MAAWGVLKDVWGLEARKSMGGSEPIRMAMMSRNSNVMDHHNLPPWRLASSVARRVNTFRVGSDSPRSQR